jgi:hypothetical protein
MFWLSPYVPDPKWPKIERHELRSDTRGLLGYIQYNAVYEDEYNIYMDIWDGRTYFPTPKTLEEAKAVLTAHFVAQRLEEP